MNSLKTFMLKLVKGKPQPSVPDDIQLPIPESVHATLSKRHRAYSVFKPVPYNHFPLFEVVVVLCNPQERSNSPRSTQVNLKAIFEDLQSGKSVHKGIDAGTIDSFVDEFNRTDDSKPPEQAHPEETHTVSETSLWSAGVKISSPAFSSGVSASRASRITRQLRLQEHYSEFYTGSQLRTLIWNNVKQVFLVIIDELCNYFPPAPRDRGLLGVVTSRTIATIGVSRSAETATAAGVNVGDPANEAELTMGGKSEKSLQENYQNLSGVSALKLIVFPIECITEDHWRVYESINVCDSDIYEDDETFTPETRNGDDFYRAQKWFLSKGELLHSSKYEDISKQDGLQNRSLGPSTASVAVAVA